MTVPSASLPEERPLSQADAGCYATSEMLVSLPLTPIQTGIAINIAALAIEILA